MLLRFLVERAKNISGTLCTATHSFHTAATCLAAEKSLLVKLRKKTGFPVGKCKDALLKFENNFQEAETWLRKEAQKEGWAKATKLQGRPMSQGLVALKLEGDAGVMVEVNCETDFVAKNTKFQGLVTKIANACLQHAATSTEQKIDFNKESLAKVPLDGATVADATALVLGNVGENMLARRAVYMRAADKQHISYYIHAAMLQSNTDDSKFLAGKYGALVITEQVADPVEPTSDLKEVGRSLCLHIVGMNPKSVGLLEDLESSDSSSSSSSSESDSEDDSEDDSDDDSVMLKQAFVLDETLRVADVVQAAGITVRDFARFECGEVLAGENED